MRQTVAINIPRPGRTLLVLGLVTLTATCLLLLAADPAHAKTFTVNSTEDVDDLDFPGGAFDGSSDGRCNVPSTSAQVCSLRAAIQEANRSGDTDIIDFDIGSTAPVKTIKPELPLPGITRPVTINGYSQPGARANTDGRPGQTNAILKVELVGTGAGADASGLSIVGSNVVVRGLVIYGFDVAGIALMGGTGHTVQGNFIGTDANGSGAAVEGNGWYGVGTVADNSTIGGTARGARNLISGNGGSITDSAGVWLGEPASGNRVQGNRINDNDSHGVSVDGTGNTVGGIDADTTDSDDPANVIALNGQDGIRVSGTGNRLLGNSVFSNGGLGIDLGDDGPTVNDAKDPDAGPNRLQNHPIISFAGTIFGSRTTIEGTLQSTPSTRKKKRTFIIQFFSSPQLDPSGYGEGATLIGRREVQTNKQGKASFKFMHAQNVLTGQSVSATATDKATGDTSEFSPARTAVEIE